MIIHLKKNQDFSSSEICHFWNRHCLQCNRGNHQGGGQTAICIQWTESPAILFILTSKKVMMVSPLHQKKKELKLPWFVLLGFRNTFSSSKKIGFTLIQIPFFKEKAEKVHYGCERYHRPNLVIFLSLRFLGQLMQWQCGGFR